MTCTSEDTRYFLPQDNPPYNKGAFRIEINFPAEYPFKPPRINFKTKIYHPNVDEKGQICLPIISAENWKPATKTDQGQSTFQSTAIFYILITIYIYAS